MWALRQRSKAKRHASSFGRPSSVDALISSKEAVRLPSKPFSSRANSGYQSPTCSGTGQGDTVLAVVTLRIRSLNCHFSRAGRGSDLNLKLAIAGGGNLAA